MGFVTRPDISFCLVDDRVIFLDLAGDRYFALAAAEEREFRAYVLGTGRDEVDMSLARLLDIGLLLEVPADVRPRPACAARCDRAFEPKDTPFVGRWAVFSALVGQLHANWLTRRRPLGDLVDRIRRMPQRAGRKDHQIPDIVAAHRQADLWLSSHDRCLAKSVALFLALRRRGADVRLVFGVAARPFAAHCWVQHDDIVLSGTVEQASLFTPILVI